MSFKIGDVEIKGKLVLGPMAGVTDLPFRMLCKEQGADLIYTEMVSAKGIMYNNKNTFTLLKMLDYERPISLQFFGSEPDIMAEMAKKIEHLNFDILDINMGCPVPKIVNNKEGSALMDNPKLIGGIVNKVSKAIKKPVTVKIRKCFREDNINAVEIAKIAEANGAKAIAIHPRSRNQYYSGKADWNIIKNVKSAVNIPVIGNGDIFTPLDAINMIEQTSCDAIMIARGAQGNPWIFSQLKYYFEHGEILPKPSIDEVIQMIERHAKMQIDFKGEFTGIREMRKHIAWYTTGYPKSSQLRNKINQLNDLDSILSLLNKWKNKQDF